MNRLAFASPQWRLLGANLIFAAIYFAAGRLGLSLAFYFPSASPVWPPSGLALAALLIYGNRLAPAIFVGAFAVNIVAPGTLGTALCIAVGNTLEALLGAWFLNRYARGRDAFHRAGDIAKALFFVAACSTPISATLGVTSLSLAGKALWENFGLIWFTWWLGDLVGIITLAPFLLIWFARPLPKISLRQFLEGAGISIILVLLATLIFEEPFTKGIRLYPVFAFPPVLWMAYRFRRRGASVAAVILSGLAVYETARGYGPFTLPDANVALLHLQAFMALVTITGLVLAAVVAEQIRSEQYLRVQYGITRVLTEASTLQEAAPQILTAVCEAAGWEFGAIWRVDQSAQVLRCVEVWNLPNLKFENFSQVTRSLTFAKGSGLPGRIWANASPHWIRDVLHDLNFPRASAASKDRLHAGFGFPILLNREVLGIIEFFTREIREPDQDFLQMVAAAGSQIGQFIHRKEAEAELRAAKDQLKSHAEDLEKRVAARTAQLQGTIESLESFSYSIAHDLRAPLRAMAGFTSILREQYAAKLGPEAQDIARRIMDGAARMDQLIVDLLAYGKLTHMELTLGRVDVNEVLQQVRDDLAEQITARKARLEIADSMPRVRANRTVLEQVFVNLVGNALKFVAPEVPPAIQITAQDDTNVVRISVRDNGIGINAKAQARIFKVFERGHVGDYPGTGIGLAIVRLGIERMGGRVGVESAPGQGSCFWVELPKA